MIKKKHKRVDLNKASSQNEPFSIMQCILIDYDNSVVEEMEIQTKIS